MLLHPQMLTPGLIEPNAYYPTHYPVDMMPFYPQQQIQQNERLLYDMYQQQQNMAAMYPTAMWFPPAMNSLGEGLTGEEDAELTCNDCSQRFLFSAYEQLFFLARGYRIPMRCKSCRTLANQARAARNAPAVVEDGDSLIGPCRSCNQMFVFSSGEKEFFRERGFQEPVRCRSCRRARRQHHSPTSSTLNSFDKLTLDDKPKKTGDEENGEEDEEEEQEQDQPQPKQLQTNKEKKET